MKFAFSTVACPKWDFETVAKNAREYGYDGVEIRGFLNESILSTANVFLTDPGKLRALFAYHQVEIACLSSSIAFTGSKKKDAAMGADLRRFVDTAAAVGCPLVKIFDTQVRAGQTRASAGVAMGDWLLPVGDYAADHGVVIVVENALSFRSSKELWTMFERIEPQSVAVCWDVFNAATIGESPLTSVPTLNNRIRYVHVKDAKLGPLGVTYCKLGEGDVAVKLLLSRLQGIGYGGYVTVDWEKAWLPGLAEPEEILPDSIGKLRDWTKPWEEPKKKEHATAKA